LQQGTALWPFNRLHAANTVQPEHYLRQPTVNAQVQFTRSEHAVLLFSSCHETLGTTAGPDTGRQVTDGTTGTRVCRDQMKVASEFRSLSGPSAEQLQHNVLDICPTAELCNITARDNRTRDCPYHSMPEINDQKSPSCNSKNCNIFVRFICIAYCSNNQSIQSTATLMHSGD